MHNSEEAASHSAPPASPPQQWTLEDLNDDCIECIFIRLPDLISQLQFSRTSQRFHAIAARCWQYHTHSAYRTLCLEEWREWLPQHEDIRDFLHAVQPALCEWRITDDCLSATLKDLEDLEVMGSCLPSVTSFELTSYADHGCSPSDEDVDTLVRLLPNLKSLRLTPVISGRHLARFTHLEELHLYGDMDKEVEIENVHLREICTQLKHLRLLDIRAFELSSLDCRPLAACERLEVLKLNLNALKPVLHCVLALPRLQKLIVFLDSVIDTSLILNVDAYDYRIYETQEFFEILTKQSERIVGLAVDNLYMPLSVGWDAQLPHLRLRKLRKFAFCNCEFPSDALDPYVGMSNLELLSVRYWEQLTNDTVLQFIEFCPQLREVDVSYCKKLTKALLYKTLALLEKRCGTQAEQSAPLIIYYLQSGLEEEVEKTNPKFWSTQQKLIKLSDDFPPNSEKGLSYVERGYEFDFECIKS